MTEMVLDGAEFPDVSVVLPCYTEKRLDSIRGALTSLRKQTLEPKRVIVAVDNNPGLAAALRDEFDWVTVVLNDGARGASADRNRGVEAVDTAVTAFLDDDETAEPDWLRELVIPFSDPDVVGTGGKYEPDWATGKPVWFPDEFAWAIGGSYLGMPTGTEPIRNVWSGNMAVRTDDFRRVGGFRNDFGKRGAFSQPEDTDFCIRTAEATGKYWMYVPAAAIQHDVPAERSTLSFFVSRCFSEGAGKAAMSSKLGSGNAVGVEVGYAQRVVVKSLRKLAQLRWREFLQALVMMLGLTSAGAGYLYGRTVRTASPKDATSRSSDLKPALVRDFEMTEPVDAFVDSLPELDAYTQLWVLVRRHRRPVGIVEGRADVTDIRHRLARFVSSRDDPGPRPAAAAHGPGDPSITVVICTRERPADLARAIGSLTAQTDTRFRVLVVDNAPRTDATEQVVRAAESELQRLDYVVEPTPGLSWARNRALQQVDTDIVAWIDDDETADENWITEILDGFASHPDAAAVSGSVVPAELETWAQWWFEQYGGHSKGRGFTEAVFQDGDAGGQSPLYPLPPFGAGANMAIRTNVLRDLGGFDTALGAGTPAFGGEDTLMFSQLLVAGHTVVYRPSAMTRHYHRREFAELEKQMFGYGVGLTAFYTALVCWNPRLLPELIRLAPRALADMFGRSGSSATTGLSEEFPPRLLRLKRNGLFKGPWAYMHARRAAGRRGGDR